MPRRRDGDISISVVASDVFAGCYEWIIRSPDGQRLVRSPYAFATKAAARLSSECRKQELIDGNSMA